MTEQVPDGEPELAELIRSVDVRAPQELYDRVQAMIDERSRRRRPSAGLGWRLGGAAAALAAAAVVLVLVLGGGSAGSGLTLERASAVVRRPATLPAPNESPSNGKQLAVAVEGVAFPYWGEHFRWSASGARVDRLDGRTITTVFYQDERGRRIGYAIVGGTPPPAISAGTAWRHDGTVFHVATVNGAHVVTWLRDGHLCIVSGRGTSAATLLALASWPANATTT
ncbi:MAG: hypothetical protein ACLQBB_02915 [Solirubrobacteraceae bacterium]